MVFFGSEIKNLVNLIYIQKQILNDKISNIHPINTRVKVDLTWDPLL